MKKTILKILTALIIISVGCTTSYANFSEKNIYGVSTKVESVFKKYTSSLENKYGHKISIQKIKSLQNKIYSYQEDFNFSGDRKIILESLEKLSNEYISQETYILEKSEELLKIKSFSYSELFANKIFKSNDIFLENGVWYTYIFSDHLTFENGVTPSLRDFKYNNISPKEDLFFITKEGKPGYAQEYKKIRLTSNRIIYGIPDKMIFLQELRDDKFYLHDKSSDITLLEIKNISEKLKNNSKNRKEFIEKIYDYVLKNIEYTKNIDLNNKAIFSGIKTFENNSGVCEGYTKLFQYLAQFGGIQDVKTIRGYVVDAQDYPEIGHAWIQIGEKYYDPTFDDPIGAKRNRELGEYYYFGLPKKLFYTNRYEYGNNNEILEKSPLEYRKQWIYKNLINVYPDFKNKGYKILESLEFRDKYNIDFQTELNKELLFEKVGFLEVKNFKNMNNNLQIQTLQYFDIQDTTDINGLLKQIGYNFEKYTLIKWYDNNEHVKYRIGFNIEYN